MNKFLLALLLGLCSFASQASGLSNVAKRLADNLNNIYDISRRLGDFGAPLADLSKLSYYAGLFNETLVREEYNHLIYNFDWSQKSWGSMNSYHYERELFRDAERDMTLIRTIMEGSPLIIPEIGYGFAITTQGDQESACKQSTVHALHAVARACDSRRSSRLLTSRFVNCECRRNPESNVEYNCRAEARGECEIYDFLLK